MNQFKQICFKLTRDYVRAGHPNPVKAAVTTANKFLREMKKEEKNQPKVEEPWVEK